MDDELWLAWRDLTRFLHSTRIALQREKVLWEGLELNQPQGVQLRVPVQGPSARGAYKVAVAEHVETLGSFRMLYGSVLIHSTAIAEAAISDVLNVDRLTSGVEVWGQDFLSRSGKGWSDVMGGLEGVLRAYIVRNGFAHGSMRWSQKSVNRFQNQGFLPPSVNSPLTLTYEELVKHRGQIQSLLNVGGLGTLA